MKKLIKADLSKVLELTAAYQPIDRDSLKAELEILEQSRHNDYLFLARKDRFRLMALSEVYTAGSDANGFLALFEVQTCWPVLALLLHVEYMESGIHRGSVVLMDYFELVRDVALFDRLPDAQREGHIKQLITRCVRYAPQCTMVDLIEYLREMSKTVGKSSPQTGKWEAKELGASQGRKNHSAVNPAPTKGMEKTDQAERRSCLAER